MGFAGLRAWLSGVDWPKSLVFPSHTQQPECREEEPDGSVVQSWCFPASQEGKTRGQVSLS